MQRRTWLAGLGVLLCLFAFVGTVSAREFFNGDQCVIAADETYDGDVFVLCEDLTIRGTVRGDVIGAAVRASIDGQVQGNVYLVAAQADVRGVITEDMHFGGVWLRVNPPVDDADTAQDQNERTGTATDAEGDLQRPLRGSLKGVALSIELFENTEISDGIVAAGYQMLLHGNVKGEISYWGSALIIDGTTSTDVYATVGDPSSEISQLETLLLPFQFELTLRNPGLVLMEAGSVGGSLVYTGPAQGTFQGSVADDIVYEPVNVVPLTTIEEPGDLTIYISQLGREFTTLAFIGALALIFSPGLVQLPLTNLRMRPFASFSVGMLAFILSFPVILIIVVLTIIVLVVLQVIGLSGLVLALGILLGMVNVAGISLFYFVAIYAARALMGLAVGRFILRVTVGNDRQIQMQYIGLVLGVFLLSAAVSLPLVGPLINAAALFLGLGTILNVVMDKFRSIRDSTPTPAPAWYAPSPAAQRSRERRQLQQSQPPQSPPSVQVLKVPDDDDEITVPVAADDDDEPASDDPAPEPEPDETPSEPSPPIDDVMPHPSDDYRAGMDNLPEGFDFSFFRDDDDNDDKPPDTD